MIIPRSWCTIVVPEEVPFGLACCHPEGWGAGPAGVEGWGGRPLEGWELKLIVQGTSAPLTMGWVCGVSTLPLDLDVVLTLLTVKLQEYPKGRDP